MKDDEMRKVLIDGQSCVGPTFSRAEFALIKRNLAKQKGLESLADLLDAAGNIQRLKMLYLLHAHKEMCVCDIAEILEITDSAVSQHLRKLKDRNLVNARRNGQTIYYSLIQKVFTSSLQDIFSLEQTGKEHAFLFSEKA